MPYDATQPVGTCTVCASPANILRTAFPRGEVVNCLRCGDFEVSHTVADDVGLPFTAAKDRALASYTIRKLQKSDAPRPGLTMEFFGALKTLSLPTAADMMDNLLLMLAEQADERPGKELAVLYSDASVLGRIGAVEASDVQWTTAFLRTEGRIVGEVGNVSASKVRLTPAGWRRVDELNRAHISSRYAFFARQFSNNDLNRLFDNCLRQAVSDTGYELRTVTQRAGLIDAVIEDEIRRCRFVIVDLFDGNAGAYWEGGFAQGLGKDVIYICRAKDEHGEEMATHFDANHRQTVRWDLAEPEDFATRIKAVIRNTLLGDANQSD